MNMQVESFETPQTPKEGYSGPITRSMTRKGDGNNNGAPPELPSHITTDMLDAYSKTFQENPVNILARNAITQVGPRWIALSQPEIAKVQHIFSHEISPQGHATDQSQSGRCWIFAGLNVLRTAFMEEHDLNDFEFSQTHLFFHDKIEKANYYLDQIIETAHLDINSDEVKWLNYSPASDGGYWSWFANLVSKYGVMPKSVMPETYNTESSRHMNWILSQKLREYAVDLRKMHNAGVSKSQLIEKKREVMAEVYKILAINLGEPPKEFDWEYENKDGDIVVVEGLTATTFYEDLVSTKVEDKVTLVNSPMEGRPFYRAYQSKDVNNMKGGKPMRFIHLPIEELEKYTSRSIEEGEGVWFAADVSPFFNGSLGTLDQGIWDYSAIYGTDFNMNKTDRILYHQSSANHAMMFTGFNESTDGNIDRWQVENSWGRNTGDSGYFIMSPQWFRDYVYEVIIDKKYLPENILNLLDEEPMELPAWDPMMQAVRVKEHSTCLLNSQDMIKA